MTTAVLTHERRSAGGGASVALLPRRFQPDLTLGYQLDLLALVEELRTLSPEHARTCAERAIGVVESRRLELRELGVAPPDLRPTVAYVAALRVLRDLLSQGWAIDRDADGIVLTPPAAAFGGADDPSAAKGAMRESFSFARRAQLATPATARFIRDMERRGIERLFAEGPELAARLTRAAAGEIDLAEAVRPTLHLVSPDARDEETRLRLQDIWRYARLFWSIPYQSTPGRNLFYLVRDEAGPGRPLIGIAALGNAVLGLAARDDALGWSAESLYGRLSTGGREERDALLSHLKAVLNNAFASVLTDDLPLREDRGRRQAVALRAVEQAASRSRSKALLDAGDERTSDYDLIRAAHVDAMVDKDVDWETIARTDLYRRKRAATLADLVEAETALEEWTAMRGSDGLIEMLADPDGRRAVETVLRRIKQRAIAENVMEITTCGAVPPYGDALGGKLVSMLLTSPRVVRDFGDRYAERSSLIASGLAGRPIHRPARLALLTTSSLYAVGSSQYNRVRIDAPGSGRVSYDRVGVTESFGTVHFAPDTAAALVDLARLANDNRRIVNNLFGEGMSPKLRSLRSGLEALGLPAEVFLRHHSPRLLYAVRLARNTDAVLLGLQSDPDYILGNPDETEGVSEIAEAWRNRWLKPRLTRADVVARISDVERATFLLGREVPPAAMEQSQPAEDPQRDGARSAPSLTSSATEFIERLYRSTNSYADRLNDEELAWVNVDLGIGGHVLELARAGRQVIVTGNPGDGKTHLIETIRPELEQLGVLVLTDANMHSDDELLDAWRACQETGRALVLAINEWPLFALRQHPRADGFEPLMEALRQVQQAVHYTQPPDPATGQVRALDLGLRNVLAPPIVSAVLDRLCDQRFYTGLHADDPALTNRTALLNGRVRERLTSVLDLVARRGHHATMRELVGFLAYLITGGQTAVDRLTHQGSGACHYANLAYEGGEGRLFDAVRNALDPAALTHPLHDLALWRGATSAEGWLDPHAASAGLQELPRDSQPGAYIALKRRFFFEHRDGADLLALLPADERAFDALVEDGERAAPTAVRDLILALNRFFEPDSNDREHLSLWQSHRFDVRAPDTFVSLRDIPRDAFRVETPQLAPWVDEWLPQDQRLTRSFALVARVGADEPMLLVDRALYLTLTESQRGLGRAGWSRSATRRVTRFVDRLQRAEPDERLIADLHIRNVETDLDDKFEVQREPPRFNL